MSRCYTCRAVSRYDECVRRPRRSRACRAGQGGRRCDRVRAACRGEGAERVVRSAKMCRADMRRHICRPIHACFVSSRITRIERMQYATCDWNGLLRNGAPLSHTVRGIGFLPIGNDSVHRSRRAYPSANVMLCTPSTGFVTGDTFSADIYTRSHEPATLQSTSARVRHASPERLPLGMRKQIRRVDTYTQPQPGAAPAHKRPRPPRTT
ncbi:hypothetical protein BLA18110_02187 [Burkholderia lata]|nr:hypothetical protein BLA18110_02187 [Burkholderia lata]